MKPIDPLIASSAALSKLRMAAFLKQYKARANRPAHTYIENDIIAVCGQRALRLSDLQVLLDASTHQSAPRHASPTTYAAPTLDLALRRRLKRMLEAETSRPDFWEELGEAVGFGLQKLPPDVAGDIVRLLRLAVDRLGTPLLPPKGKKARP